MTPADIKDVFGFPPSRIYENLWQSGVPNPLRAVKDANVEILVLASREMQPDAEGLENVKRIIPGVKLILVPLDDVENPRIMRDIGERAQQAASRVTEKLREGKTVLVTCTAGMNRSGLISALTLRELLNISGKDAVEMVRSGRAPSGRAAFTNDVFRSYVESLPALGGG